MAQASTTHCPKQVQRSPTVNLHKIWLIARREYLLNFRRRSFLFTVFGVPAITIGATLIVMALVAQQITDTSAYKRVGVVDEAGIFANAENLENAANSTQLEKPFEIIASRDEASAAVK